MQRRVTLLALLLFIAAGMAACAAEPAPEPEPVADEAPAPAAPTVYELTEVAVTEDEPGFTSRNVSVLGVKIGDQTIDVAENLGEQVGTTVNAPEDYITVYQNGGVVLYTFKLTGAVRRIEVTSRFADELVDPNLQAWLEEGVPSQLREFMGPEERVAVVPEDNNADEFVYDSRGLRFVQREIEGEPVYAVRFSQMR